MGIDFDVVGDFIRALTENVVTLERRLEDVLRVEVERRIIRDQSAGCRIQLNQPETWNAVEHGRNRSRGATCVAGERIDVEPRNFAIALIDRVGLLITDAENRVATTVVEIRADRQVAAERVAVTTLGDLVRHVEINPSKIRFGDEVHHTRNCVGTVRGHSRAGQNVGPLKQCERNVVEIDHAGQTCRNDTRTIEQNDVTVRAQTAKVNERRTAIAVIDGRTDAGNRTRQFAQKFFCGVGLLKLELVRRNDADGARRDQVGIADQRTGDNNLSALSASLFLSFLDRFRRCGHGLSEGRRCSNGSAEQQGGRKQPCAHLCFHEQYYPFLVGDVRPPHPLSNPFGSPCRSLSSFDQRQQCSFEAPQTFATPLCFSRHTIVT